jgi:hypothetical protein
MNYPPNMIVRFSDEFPHRTFTPHFVDDVGLAITMPGGIYQYWTFEQLASAGAEYSNFYINIVDSLSINWFKFEPNVQNVPVDFQK